MDGSSVDETYDDDDVLYAIDEQAYEDANEYYLLKVWDRLCWAGGCRICRRHPEGKPFLPSTTNQTAIYNAVRYCPTQPDASFIVPEMSLLEAVFRVLISDHNRPKGLHEIIEKLQELGGSAYTQRIASEAALRKVLDSQNEYRIGRVSTGAD